MTAYVMSSDQLVNFKRLDQQMLELDRIQPNEMIYFILASELRITKYKNVNYFLNVFSEEKIQYLIKILVKT